MLHTTEIMRYHGNKAEVSCTSISILVGVLVFVGESAFNACCSAAAAATLMHFLFTAASMPFSLRYLISGQDQVISNERK